MIWLTHKLLLLLNFIFFNLMWPYRIRINAINFYWHIFLSHLCQLEKHLFYIVDVISDSAYGDRP
jgi:hypothetical protein